MSKIRGSLMVLLLLAGALSLACGSEGGTGVFDSDAIVEQGAFEDVLLPEISSVSHMLVNPTEVDFGNVEVGGPAWRILTISNVGLGDLVVNPGGGCLEIADDVQGEFSIVKDESEKWKALNLDTCGEVTIIPHATRSVKLVCDPKTETGTATGKLVISTNDPETPTVAVPLNCSRCDCE